jgi:hypothetical protein
MTFCILFNTTPSLEVSTTGSRLRLQWNDMLLYIQGGPKKSEPFWKDHFSQAFGQNLKMMISLCRPFNSPQKMI